MATSEGRGRGDGRDDGRGGGRDDGRGDRRGGGRSGDDEDRPEGREAPEGRHADEEQSPPPWLHGVFVEACLSSPTREVLLDVLRRTPGLNQNQTGELLGIQPTSAAYHLEELRSYGLVEPRDGFRASEKLWFAAEDVDLWEDERTRPLFGQGPLRDVALHLAKHPGATADQIAEALGLRTNSVYPHLSTLRDHGLIDRRRIGYSYIHWATPPLQDWAEELGPAYRSAFGEPSEGAGDVDDGGDSADPSGG